MWSLSTINQINDDAAAAYREENPEMVLPLAIDLMVAIEKNPSVAAKDLNIPFVGSDVPDGYDYQDRSLFLFSYTGHSGKNAVTRLYTLLQQSVIDYGAEVCIALGNAAQFSVCVEYYLKEEDNEGS